MNIRKVVVITDNALPPLSDSTLPCLAHELFMNVHIIIVVIIIMTSKSIII